MDAEQQARWRINQAPAGARAADNVVQALLKVGAKDYTSKKDEIANLFIDQLWHGNWDSQTDFNDPEFFDLRFIQEDEFDQSMSDEDKEGLESLCYTEGHYVFLVK